MDGDCAIGTSARRYAEERRLRWRPTRAVLRPDIPEASIPDTATLPPTRGFVLDAFGGPEVLRLSERETPPPQPGEILVEVEASGVNFGDTMIRRGEYLRNQPLSMAPGCEVVGRVTARGDGVDTELGSRVAAWVEAGGAYADRVLVPAHRAYPVPDDLPAGAIAAVFLQGTTADYAVHRYGRTKKGEWVLVHGAAGGVGGLAMQLAKLAGAHVIATASTEPKRAAILEQGADVTLDSTQPDCLAAAVRSATGDRGCDVVIDGVGGDLFEPSLRALAFGGRYVVAGSASQQPAMLDVRRLLPRNQTIAGFILHHIAAEDPDEPTRTLVALCDLVRDGKLTPRYIAVPLDQAPEIHRRIEARTLSGKVVLEP
jgi:NADPH2:quinone reductase